MGDTSRTANPAGKGARRSTQRSSFSLKAPAEKNLSSSSRSPFTIRPSSSSKAKTGTLVSTYGSGHVPYEQSLDEKLANLGIEIGARVKQQAMQNVNHHQLPYHQPLATSGGADGGKSLEEDSGISRESSDVSGRKSSRLSSDISKRISGISSTMDQYDKSVRNVNESMQEAYRKSLHDMRKRSSRNASPSPDETVDSAEAFLLKCRDELKKDLQSSVPSTSSKSLSGGGDASSLPLLMVKSPRKIFGLDAAALLKSSSSEEEDDSSSSKASSNEDEDDTDGNVPGGMRISIRGKSAALKRFEENKSKRQQQKRPARSKVKKKGGQKGEEEDMQRSLSPIMPTIPDKQFQTILERREERVSRHLNTMKNELAQLNHKVEMDKKRAAGGGGGARKGIMDTSYQGRPMRLMKQYPDKVVGNEFNEFLQSSGGKAGGWERQDHNVFLKTFDIWRKRPNKLMEALKKELPNKRAKEIASHIQWYERFEELSKANKADVHKWSQEKRKENELVYRMGSEAQRAKLEDDKRRQEHLRMIREQERDKSKEKLAQWKRTQSLHQPAQPHHLSLSSNKPPIAKFHDDSGNVDIHEVRQHILDITAKVHALDNPKRDFRPPRPPVSTGDTKAPPASRGYPPIHTRQNSAGGGQQMVSLRKPTFSRSFTNVTSGNKDGSVVINARLDSAPDNTPGALNHEEDVGDRSIYNRRNNSPVEKVERRVERLPEVEPEFLRPNSRQKSRVSEFRERDIRLTEAKKKAVEIARERRKSSLNQLTAEEIRRRIRNRGGGPSTLNNPTKQSQLRKSITHLERLEMLSKQDLSQLSLSHPQIGGEEGRFDPGALTNSTMPTKGVPSWRKPTDFF